MDELCPGRWFSDDYFMFHTILQSLGVNSSNDKNVIKKKIKDLKAAIEKERKQQEKAQKAKEKLEGKSKKKFGFGKWKPNLSTYRQ